MRKTLCVSLLNNKSNLCTDKFVEIYTQAAGPAMDLWTRSEALKVIKGSKVGPERLMDGEVTV